MRNSKWICFLVSLLIFLGRAVAQDIMYDTSGITAAMRKDAHVVVRYEQTELEVSDVDEMKLHVHRIETVLNEKGRDALIISQITDKFTSLDDIEVRVYDASGKQVNKIKQHDFIVQSGGDEFIDDSKIYYYRVRANSYPITLETNYKIKYKGTFNYPNYHILVANEAIENSSFTARVNKEMGLRYKEKNIQLTPTVTADGNYNVYTWTVKNIPSVPYEANSVSARYRYPSIMMAPKQFKMGKYSGDLSSWKNMGLWYNDLLVGMDTLSDQQKTFYRNLVKGVSTDQEKEKILYNYLQKNFRYVSIQLGIGGWQPISADITDTKKYGDCKGLSNYMVSVLKAVNIKAYMALVNSGSNQEPVDKDFPCNQFNHVIVCIPGKKDSVWLECTSNTTDFNVLSNFTENRNALLLTENGGFLVPTPRSRPSENIFRSYSIIDLNEDGSGKTNTVFTSSGEYKERILGLRDEKEEDQKVYMISEWGFKEPNQYRFDKDDQQMYFHLSLDQELEKVPELKTGSKMFLRPSLVSLWTTSLAKDDNRHQDFFFNCPSEKADTTLVNLPEGYRVDALPHSISDTSKYGTFALRCWTDEKTRQVYTATKLVLNEYRIPAADYSMVRKFFDSILLSYEERIVIKKE